MFAQACRQAGVHVLSIVEAFGTDGGGIRRRLCLTISCFLSGLALIEQVSVPRSLRCP